ncbi:hypothetical protein [Paraburkholderia caribensis]|uniref:hypothetical protein n=1 Tax=Paraburkholderia caribensis TaxID=75105 RepID=UPI0034D2FC05
MSDKFDMKLVIDAVSTPLLYEKLSQAGSARVRAALLRSLAEAALRGDGNGARSESATAFLASLPTPTSVAHELTSKPEASPPLEREPAATEAGAASINEEDAGQAFDVDQIGEAFGAFV